MDNTIIDRIKGELKAFNEKKKALVEELRKDFPGLIKPLLEESQLINSISWTQYTPYFNDGDECVFRSNACDFGINGGLYGENHDENGTEFWRKEAYSYIHKKYMPNDDYNENEAKIHEGLSEILGEIPDEFYEELFGNHVKITIFKDGTIDIEEYNHD